MRYIEKNETSGRLYVLGSYIDVTDFRRLLSIFEKLDLTPGFKDPRLTFLCMVEARKPESFREVTAAFLKQRGFVTSLTLYFKQHLPQKIHDRLACRTLWKIFKIAGLDPQSYPSCPHCFARMADKFFVMKNHREGELPGKFLQLARFYTVGSQAALWQEGIVRILEVFMQQKKLHLLNWEQLGEALQQSIPNQENFSEMIQQMLQLPSCFEYIYDNSLDARIRTLFEIWSGETLNPSYVKKVLKKRTNIYKEDLMIKTWHPRRLVKWCLDLEDLSDFDLNELEEFDYNNL